MAALGSSLLRQRHLHHGRVGIMLHPVIVAQLGLRSILRPTQAIVCPMRVYTRKGSAFPRRHRCSGRQLVVRAVAMVNVDFASPSLLLGTMLIGCGVLLLNLRNFQNKVSRDADIVVAAMVSIVGSTLIFQGWRLDPLLLLCQALTTSVAFWYGLETFRLRSKEADTPPPQLPPGVGPPDAAPQDFLQQAAAAAAQQQQQQQQQYYQAGPGFPPPGSGLPYLPPGNESYYPWGNPSDAAASTSDQATGLYGETIQYDYYGNPIMQQQQEPVYSGRGYSNVTFGGAMYGAPGDPYSRIGEGSDSAYGGSGMYGAAGAPESSGYDTSGSTAGSPGPSYAGPFSGPAAPPPPPGVSQTSAQPFDGSGPGAPGPLGPYGRTPGFLYDRGFGAGSLSDGGPWGPDAAPPAAAAAAEGGAAGGQQPSGGVSGSGIGGGGVARGRGASRLELYEQVDDWE
ncbi:hypothetical protein VOLCADRAFT_121328 [Volvox carteri f. nagariensis]|uniref:Uncharacterized protein n=1 Tax=Volvox carteri f. nagariensis TaxID=3068 RepID=D8U7E0_VOLCA|nr:uncharacterized protein VOLCADRAFT_121328 [Volvox carteri f. nagariensis]EFJ44404.1 hypothetical protein VOLCADRAFT_121328 [Volvox carteri f. nagariensis]|eukprot:XP_002954511.1 hypothetical protein VOLCADRAFT_121328 [Volvox carteri f. nagariensis]